jgi:uncharacterized integral membrane protein
MIYSVFLAIVILALLFAVQNSAPVTVSLLFWKFDASLSIVILLSVLAGTVIATLFFVSNRFRGKRKKRAEKRDIPPAEP